MRWEFMRFLLVGASNTLLSWALFVVLVRLMSYPYAYTLAYAISIVCSYLLNVHFVFKERISLAGFLKFPLVYLLQYTLGMLVMWLLVGKMGVLPEVAMIVVITVTIPITFLASRKIIKPVQQVNCSVASNDKACNE